MKQTLFNTILSLLLLTSMAFAQDKKAYDVDNSSIALQGYSPVSYADLGLAQKGLREFKSEHDNIIFYFTSSEQKSKFDNNPEKYLPPYGGYCAFGIYRGAKFRPDPNKFITKDGTYYLFLYNLELDAKQRWLEAGHHDDLVKKADINWKKLKKIYN